MSSTNTHRPTWNNEKRFRISDVGFLYSCAAEKAAYENYNTEIIIILISY